MGTCIGVAITVVLFFSQTVKLTTGLEVPNKNCTSVSKKYCCIKNVLKIAKIYIYEN